MEWNQVLQLIGESIALTASIDGQLFVIDAHEPTIAHRMAFHLENVMQQRVPEQSTHNPFRIDCEYDMMGDQRKQMRRSRAPELYDQLWRCRSRKRDRGVVGVCPDIIIHRRLQPQLHNNLLVVELKTGRSPDDPCDHLKLTAFTLPGMFDFQYQYGLFLRLRAADELSIEAVLECAQKYEQGDKTDVTNELTASISSHLLPGSSHRA